jgi:hypothetical protein
MWRNIEAENQRKLAINGIILKAESVMKMSGMSKRRKYQL